jgi:hypothetical protein
MALAKQKAINTTTPGSTERHLVNQFNALLTELRVWAVRLDAETLADSDYTARLDAAVSLIADETDTTITT